MPGRKATVVGACLAAVVTLACNRGPDIDEVPAGTKSFALLCIDPDVPSKPDDVNQPYREVPAGLPRIDFTHWSMIDIDAVEMKWPSRFS